jgi:hypothetical protein
MPGRYHVPILLYSSDSDSQLLVSKIHTLISPLFSSFCGCQELKTSVDLKIFHNLSDLPARRSHKSHFTRVACRTNQAILAQKHRKKKLRCPTQALPPSTRITMACMKRSKKLQLKIKAKLKDLKTACVILVTRLTMGRARVLRAGRLAFLMGFVSE